MRRHDWSSQLYLQIDFHKDRPFIWGDNDCCLFVARVVDAMCDTNHEMMLRQKYQDETSALQYIARSGGIAAAVDTFIGPHKSEGRPMRGDVALIHINNRYALGIFVGREIAIKTTDGVSYVDRSVLIKFWSI